MNGKFQNPPLLPFPAGVGAKKEGPASVKIDHFETRSLVDDDNRPGSSSPSRNAPISSPIGRLLFGVWQQPIGKMGLIILFLGWLLWVVATTASLLSWIGTLGMVTGTAFLSLSLFSNCLKNMRSQSSQNEEAPDHGRSGPT